MNSIVGIFDEYLVNSIYECFDNKLTNEFIPLTDIFKVLMDKKMQNQSVLVLLSKYRLNLLDFIKSYESFFEIKLNDSDNTANQIEIGCIRSRCGNKVIDFHIIDMITKFIGRQVSQLVLASDVWKYLKGERLQDGSAEDTLKINYSSLYDFLEQHRIYFSLIKSREIKCFEITLLPPSSISQIDFDSRDDFTICQIIIQYLLSCPDKSSDAKSIQSYLENYYLLQDDATAHMIMLKSHYNLYRFITSLDVKRFFSITIDDALDEYAIYLGNIILNSGINNSNLSYSTAAPAPEPATIRSNYNNNNNNQEIRQIQQITSHALSLPYQESSTIVNKVPNRQPLPNPSNHMNRGGGILSPPAVVENTIQDEMSLVSMLMNLLKFPEGSLSLSDLHYQLLHMDTCQNHDVIQTVTVDRLNELISKYAVFQTIQNIENPRKSIIELRDPKLVYDIFLMETITEFILRCPQGTCLANELWRYLSSPAVQVAEKLAKDLLLKHYFSLHDFIATYPQCFHIQELPSDLPFTVYLTENGLTNFENRKHNENNNGLIHEFHILSLLIHSLATFPNQCISSEELNLFIKISTNILYNPMFPSINRKNIRKTLEKYKDCFLIVSYPQLMSYTIQLTEDYRWNYQHQHIGTRLVSYTKVFKEGNILTTSRRIAQKGFIAQQNKLAQKKNLTVTPSSPTTTSPTTTITTTTTTTITTTTSPTTTITTRPVPIEESSFAPFTISYQKILSMKRRKNALINIIIQILKFATNGMSKFHEIEEELSQQWKIDQIPAITEFKQQFDNWEELMAEYFIYFYVLKEDRKQTIRLRSGIWQDADGVTEAYDFLLIVDYLSTRPNESCCSTEVVTYLTACYHNHPGGSGYTILSRILSRHPSLFHFVRKFNEVLHIVSHHDSSEFTISLKYCQSNNQKANNRSDPFVPLVTSIETVTSLSLVLQRQGNNPTVASVPTGTITKKQLPELARFLIKLLEDSPGQSLGSLEVESLMNSTTLSDGNLAIGHLLEISRGRLKSFLRCYCEYFVLSSWKNDGFLIKLRPSTTTATIGQTEGGNNALPLVSADTSTGTGTVRSLIDENNNRKRECDMSDPLTINEVPPLRIDAMAEISLVELLAKILTAFPSHRCSVNLLIEIVKHSRLPNGMNASVFLKEYFTSIRQFIKHHSNCLCFIEYYNKSIYDIQLLPRHLQYISSLYSQLMNTIIFHTNNANFSTNDAPKLPLTQAPLPSANLPPVHFDSDINENSAAIGFTTAHNAFITKTSFSHLTCEETDNLLTGLKSTSQYNDISTSSLKSNSNANNKDSNSTYDSTRCRKDSVHHVVSLISGRKRDTLFNDEEQLQVSNISNSCNENSSKRKKDLNLDGSSTKMLPSNLIEPYPNENNYIMENIITGDTTQLNSTIKLDEVRQKQVLAEFDQWMDFS